MLTIHKYAHVMEAGGTATFDMPRGAIVRHVGYQGQQDVAIWVEVDTKMPRMERTFTIIGTGHPAPEAWDATYLGTVQTPSGLVWHVYEPTGQMGQPR